MSGVKKEVKTFFHIFICHTLTHWLLFSNDSFTGETRYAECYHKDINRDDSEGPTLIHIA